MNRTTTVTIVGGGAAGLTAALFLARAGIPVEVVDQDRSTLKRARLENLPGRQGLEGRELLADLRAVLAEHGIEPSAGRVDDVEPTDEGFVVRVGEDAIASRYIVLASGQGLMNLPSLPLETTDPRQPFVKVNVVTDKWGATSVPGVWAAGVVAGWPSQAVVCAGSGAAVAVEIATAINGAFWVDHDDSQVRAAD